MKTTTFTNTEKKAIKINKIYLLLFIICLPLFTLAQLTYVPDDNFEDYLESHSMGNGIANDDYVLTSNINTVTYLSLNNENISDLTGIEDFTSLQTLMCSNNPITSLDLSQNIALTDLFLHANQLSSLDISQNPALTTLHCAENLLTSLDLRNGNNISMDSNFYCYDNPNLTCINVDDSAWSTTNWTVANQNIDPQHYFSENCP